jgi:hypothetical protein
VESFNGKARDELFAREIFDSILEARIPYEDWRHVYNLHRPHSSLGLQPPAVFAAAFNNRKLSPAPDTDPVCWTHERGPVRLNGSPWRTKPPLS